MSLEKLKEHQTNILHIIDVINEALETKSLSPKDLELAKKNMLKLMQDIRGHIIIDEFLLTRSHENYSIS